MQEPTTDRLLGAVASTSKNSDLAAGKSPEMLQRRNLLRFAEAFGSSLFFFQKANERFAK
jgi:hypothetical protein